MRTLFSLVILGMLIAALVFGVIQLSNFISSLDNKTGPAVIGGIIAISLALFGFWREVRKSRLEAHRERKVEIYSKFSGIVFGMLRSLKSDGPELSEFVASEQFTQEMYDLKEGIIFYGSPKVIKTFSKWLVEANLKKENDDQLKEVGDIFLAMRSDLGLSNFGLDNLNIHQIYITDDLSKK